jgi:uncharacterized protein YrzB (UPF0473 family)
MAEERDNIVVLIDEDGEEEEFEFVDSIEINVASGKFDSLMT